jgi:hypothetical protein
MPTAKHAKNKTKTGQPGFGIANSSRRHRRMGGAWRPF